MVLWVALALADAGSKQCTMRGIPLDVKWTQSGDVTVHAGGSLLVNVDIGALNGVTTLHCRDGEILEFLTDTQKVRGRFNLEKVKVELGSILDTVDASRFAKVAPKPASRPPRPRPKPKSAPASADSEGTGERQRPSHPGEAEADDCVNTKVWDAYDEGWRVRSVSSEVLQPYTRKNLALSVLAGNTYRFVACGQEGVEDLDLVLYSAEGKPLALDRTDDRTPTVEYAPDETQTVHAVIAHPGGSDPVGVAVGVLSSSTP